MVESQVDQYVSSTSYGWDILQLVREDAELNFVRRGGISWDVMSTLALEYGTRSD